MDTHTFSPLECEAPVFFATTEGQTRRIAERIVAVLRAHGIDSCAFDVGHSHREVDWSRVRGAIVGASLHVQKHQPAADAFVREHVAELNRIPSAFFSVSLSAASRNQQEVEAARRIAEQFTTRLGWTPSIITTIAGCLAYTKYGFLKRQLLKRIAKKEGAPTDTSRDYEMTDWTKVEQFARDMAERISTRRIATGAAAA